ncbi:transcriptional regulator [Ktedonobacter sp. SOSP1-52]|uniref:RrF2 family transcriptional regulator n=1 Tax=Ktedonobacter sp. SOSP1-52 TaxID=2778366 RepID=UPI001915A719|nr:Rrf2 family transcriptional regulator [Ktedonobacter sp. SOSP1-52]GHO71971.1 transcriptional regulator [Ktedonobacter sp. SOSP1-52]
MKLSEGVEWGIHCASMLADLPEGAVLPTKVLAEYHGVSETYLAKHLQALKNAGIIGSVPGPKGGVYLLKKPEELTLLDIVDAIEGKEPIFRCTEIRQRSPIPCSQGEFDIPCDIHMAMLKANKAWRDALQAQTLASVIRPYKATLQPEKKALINAYMEKVIRK